MRNSTIYHLAVPRTFRRSSRQIFKKCGSNLQNVPDNLRVIYITDGYSEALKDKCKYWLATFDNSVFTEEELVSLRVFLNADQSGAEALAMAYDSKPGNYRQLFINNVNPHVYLALQLFIDKWPDENKKAGGAEIDFDLLRKIPIPLLKLNPDWKEATKLIKQSDQWPSARRYYYMAKQTGHSGNYDIQAGMFQLNTLEKSKGKINLSKVQATEFLQMYRGLYPEIPERNERVRQQVDRYKIIYNMFGFPLIVTNYDIMEHTYKEFYAWSPQSTIGEITRIAITNMQTYIEEMQKKWDIMQDNHDSNLVQSPILEWRECATKQREYINQELTSTVDQIKFRMKSECKIGFNWGSRSDDNPLGLKEVNL